MLTGLVRSDSGSVEVLGHEVPSRLPEVVSEVSSVVESPRFFPSFSGRTNLSLLAEVAGIPVDRISE